jgi:hypothetical protein
MKIFIFLYKNRLEQEALSTKFDKRAEKYRQVKGLLPKITSKITQQAMWAASTISTQIKTLKHSKTQISLKVSAKPTNS